MLRSTLFGAVVLTAALPLLVVGTAAPSEASAAAPIPGAPAAAQTPSTPSIPAARPGGAQPPQGHVLLVVSGDAAALAVDHAVRKPDPWHSTQRLDSPFRLRVFAKDGALLGSYPMDLSAFDLDPAHRGNGLRVEGCKVVDTRVHALIAIPHHPDGHRVEFVRLGKQGGTPLGGVPAPRWRELMEESR